jgi:hypothetical protein
MMHLVNDIVLLIGYRPMLGFQVGIIIIEKQFVALFVLPRFQSDMTRSRASCLCLGLVSPQIK